VRALRIPLGIAAVVGALALALASSGCGGSDPSAAVSGAPRHIIYLSEFRIRTVLERLLPNGPGPLERIDTFRQLPAAETILPPQNRIARVDGKVIATLPSDQIAMRLRRAIDGTCNPALPCASHLVAIDDINTEFMGASGTRLKAAMDQLNDESPWGSTYAKRVVMYVAYPMMASLASSATPGRWENAVAAVAAGESYWLEMYQSTGKGQIGGVSYHAWQTLPRATMRALVAAGGELSRGHFMMGPSKGPVEGMPARLCPSSVGCVWVASQSTPLNRQLAHQGTGVYRFGPRQLGALCFQNIAMHGTDEGLYSDVITHLCREWTPTTSAGSTHAQG
jgi:hypothetical protein